MKEYKYKINGNNYAVNIVKVDGNVAEVEVNGTSYRVEMETPIKKSVTLQVKRPAAVSPVAPGNPAAPTSAPTQTISPATPAGGHVIKSPLPGVILELCCKPGDQVKKGQKLMVLEAMKMENAIPADRDGVIKEVFVAQGKSILEGDNLVTIG